MDHDQGQAPSAAVGASTARRNHWKILILCTIIIALGIAGASYLNRTAPQAHKRPPEQTAALVQTQPLFPGSHQVAVSGMGTVVPATEITLKSRVSGEIQAVHPEFVQGGFIRGGEKVLRIDPTDYELAIARRQSAVADAEYALKVEMGYQDVARREWSLLNPGGATSDQEAELALRKPHLAKARSDLAAARADLEQARLNLARTDIIAPFNAVVRTTNVDVGSQVTSQDDLAQLVGTDNYWVQVSLPVDRLAWIRIPRDNSERGADATVLYRGFRRHGTVIRLLSDLETEGRMARILVAVSDPLGLAPATHDQSPPLLIGEYVRVEIEGQHLHDVYRIPRSALRDNSTIWLLSETNALQIVPVQTIWRDAGTVVVKNGLQPGLRLVVSDLAAPVNGMALWDNGDASTPAGQGAVGG